MNYDQYGRPKIASKDLVNLLYQQPDLSLADYFVEDPEQYNNSVKSLHLDFDLLSAYQPLQCTIEEFDSLNQRRWYMPDEYKNLDIAAWLLDQCTTQEQLQRIGEELLLFQERNLFPLLCYLKYLVDTMRTNNIVWGVGRGSSVASYALFLLGVHRIDSMYYDLSIKEFLKD